MEKDAEGRPLYRIRASVDIEETPERTWELLTRPAGWWMEADDAHVATQTPEGRLAEGSRWVILERVAGVLGVANGTITELDEGRTLTWHAPDARYRFFAIPIGIDERVTWTVEPSGEGARLTVSAVDRFGTGLAARSAAWVFERLLDGVRRGNVHAERELEYVKRLLEGRIGEPSEEIAAERPGR